MSAALIKALKAIGARKLTHETVKTTLERFGLETKTVLLRNHSLDNEFDLRVHELQINEQYYYSLTDPRRI